MHKQTARYLLLAACLGFFLLWLFLSLGNLRALFGPSFFGFPGSNRNYLVIFQNNYELRPTGGFISAYGILKFRHGLFAGIDIQDTFGKIDDHPYVEPPEPMKELLAHEFYRGYTFRDANWDPDFPKTAEELEKFLHINFPQQKIDGVIAVDFTVLEDLIGVLGKIKAEGDIFTKDTAFELVEHSVSDIDRHSVIEIENRKSVLKVIAQKLIWKTLLRPWKLDDVADMLAKNLDRKHILLFFKNPKLQGKAEQKNWAGRFDLPVIADKNDYIALVEANLGGMKSNRVIARDITYEVNLKTRKSKLDIEYKHFGELNVPLSGDYKGHLRTYVPENTFEKTLFIPHGQELEFNYAYLVTEKVFNPSDNRYTLTLYKQPGTLGDRYRIAVRAPLGHRITAVATSLPKSDTPRIRHLENHAVIEGFLTRDIAFSFDILPDILPPRPAYHEITALNKIELHFNEDIAPDSVEDLLNFTIKDLNVKNTRNDSVIIENIIHNGRFLTFETKGMTIQPEEFYALEIKTVRDTSGNFLKPSPRTLTLVQRLQ